MGCSLGPVQPFDRRIDRQPAQKAGFRAFDDRLDFAAVEVRASDLAFFVELQPIQLAACMIDGDPEHSRLAADDGRDSRARRHRRALDGSGLHPVHPLSREVERDKSSGGPRDEQFLVAAVQVGSLDALPVVPVHLAEGQVERDTEWFPAEVIDHDLRFAAVQVRAANHAGVGVGPVDRAVRDVDGQPVLEPRWLQLQRLQLAAVEAGALYRGPAFPREGGEVDPGPSLGR